MNPRAEIWNVLHDGTITAIDGCVSGDIAIRVNIPYLSEMVSPSGEDILLSLSNCTKFSMNIWEEDVITDDPKRIVSTEAEILSTESNDVPVRIITTHGVIDIDFEGFSLSLDNGRALTFKELCDACDNYWNTWESEAKQDRSR